MHVTIVQKLVSNKNRTEYSPNRKKNSLKEKEKKTKWSFVW
jgi:hypothetical protein